MEGNHGADAGPSGQQPARAEAAPIEVSEAEGQTLKAGTKDLFNCLLLHS